ncbi:MAG TPA: WD40 repeat domain-containing protein, partial [Gemmataceae bacterium]|nr:WD40 repeat domain-containing protein [Gemmataceae bacterium]
SRATLSTFSPFPSSWPQSAVSFLPDGRILACGAPHQTTAEIWDIRMQRAWRPALPGHQHQVSNLAFTPDGGLLSVSYDSAIHRWGLKPDVMPRRLPEFDHDRWWPEGKYCLSTDGRSIARASMNMKVWRTADGKALWEEEAPRHHNPSSSPDLTFVASNTMLVRIDNTGVVDRWDAATGRRRKEIRGIRDIGATALSPDGHILVVVPYQWPPKGVINVQVWDLLRGRCLRQIRGARDPELADPQPGW